MIAKIQEWELITKNNETTLAIIYSEFIEIVDGIIEGQLIYTEEQVKKHQIFVNNKDDGTLHWIGRDKIESDIKDRNPDIKEVDFSLFDGKGELFCGGML